ncbi:unnamed protein product [Rhizophagus irregularis]|nr:unnamed protein product [Rhizophagus irregularis]
MLEEIICITEGKQNQATIGICQNLVQCRSACDMNLDMLKKKRKADEAFDTGLRLWHSQYRNTYNTGIQFCINSLCNFLISHMFEIV